MQYSLKIIPFHSNEYYIERNQVRKSRAKKEEDLENSRHSHFTKRRKRWHNLRKNRKGVNFGCDLGYPVAKVRDKRRKNLWVIKKKVSPSLLLAWAARAMSLIMILSSSGVSSETLLPPTDTSIIFFSQLNPISSFSSLLFLLS